ncbi:flagellar hook assembly protein FlgD [Nocardioides pacificus]
MSITATEGVAPGMYTGGPSAAAAANGEDKQMFLELLVAQLRYQDPLNPADSGEFLAQSAQFTSLEKMQEVADQTAALVSAQVTFGASNMVGKNVTYLDAEGVTKSGPVGSVSFGSGGPMLDVNGAQVTLGQVQSVVANLPAAALPAVGAPLQSGTGTTVPPTGATPETP